MFGERAVVWRSSSLFCCSRTVVLVPVVVRHRCSAGSVPVPAGTDTGSHFAFVTHRCSSVVVDRFIAVLHESFSTLTRCTFWFFFACWHHALPPVIVCCLQRSFQIQSTTATTLPLFFWASVVQVCDSIFIQRTHFCRYFLRTVPTTHLTPSDSSKSPSLLKK